MAKKESECKNCGKPHTYDTNSSAGLYCSNKCQGEYARTKNMEKWLDGTHDPNITSLRIYLRILRGDKCEICGLDIWNNKPIPLEVEHKDGDSTNNAPDNVLLICPNCHAQTDTYKAKNKGNGRHSRRERYRNGLSF